MTAQTHEQDREQDDLDLVFESVKDLEIEDAESIQGGQVPTAHAPTLNPSGG